MGIFVATLFGRQLFDVLGFFSLVSVFYFMYVDMAVVEWGSLAPLRAIHGLVNDSEPRVIIVAMIS